MRAILTIFLLTTTMTATAGAAQLFDGERLKALCSSNREAVQAYITGWHDKRFVDSQFADMVLKGKSAEEMKHAIFGTSCRTEALSVEEWADAVCTYIDAHELQRSHKGIGLVSSAILGTPPCD